MKGLLCITSLTFIAAAAAAGEALVQAIDDVKASCTATNVYAKSITGDSADAGIEGSQAWHTIAGFNSLNDLYFQNMLEQLSTEQLQGSDFNQIWEHWGTALDAYESLVLEMGESFKIRQVCELSKASYGKVFKDHITTYLYIITFMPQVLDPPPNLEELVSRQQKVYDDLKARSDLVDQSQEKGCPL